MDSPDSPDWPRVSLVDVLNMTVEDVMGDSGIEIGHLTQEEQDRCLDKIRYEYLRLVEFHSYSHTDKGYPFSCVDF